MALGFGAQIKFHALQNPLKPIDLCPEWLGDMMGEIQQRLPDQQLTGMASDAGWKNESPTWQDVFKGKSQTSSMGGIVVSTSAKNGNEYQKPVAELKIDLSKVAGISAYSAEAIIRTHHGADRFTLTRGVGSEPVHGLPSSDK